MQSLSQKELRLKAKKRNLTGYKSMSKDKLLRINNNISNNNINNNNNNSNNNSNNNNNNGGRKSLFKKN